MGKLLGNTVSTKGSLKRPNTVQAAQSTHAKKPWQKSQGF